MRASPPFQLVLPRTAGTGRSRGTRGRSPSARRGCPGRRRGRRRAPRCGRPASTVEMRWATRTTVEPAAQARVQRRRAARASVACSRAPRSCRRTGRRAARRHEGAGDGQALALAAGDVRAALGDGGARAQALARFEATNSEGAGRRRRAPRMAASSAHPSSRVGDVRLSTVPCEQEGLLGHVAAARSRSAGLRESVAQIGAVEGDRALRRVVEALDELDDGGLARSGGAYDERSVVLPGSAVNVAWARAPDRRRIGVAEGDVVEGDGRAPRPSGAARRRGPCRRLGIADGGLGFASTSLRRWAATSARGSMMETMPMMRQPMMMTMA